VITYKSTGEIITKMIMTTLFVSVVSSTAFAELTAPQTQKLPEAEIFPAVKLQRKTHPEKIIFTHVKKGGLELDVDNFAKASPNYLKAKDIDKSAILFSEYTRLANNFGLHDQNSPIIVHTRVELDEYSSLQDLIKFDEFDEKTFFAYSIYNYAVGVIPENVKQFSALELSKKRADALFKSAGTDGRITAEFMLIPTLADTKNSMTINGQETWLLATRIAEFRLWGRNEGTDILLWFHRAPWYSPEDKGNINDLFIKDQG